MQELIWLLNRENRSHNIVEVEVLFYEKFFTHFVLVHKSTSNFVLLGHPLYQNGQNSCTCESFDKVLFRSGLGLRGYVSKLGPQQLAENYHMIWLNVYWIISG